MYILTNEVESVVMNFNETRIDVDTLSLGVLNDIIFPLKTCDKNRKKEKWKSITNEKLRNVWKAEPSVLMRIFSKSELLSYAKKLSKYGWKCYSKQLDRLTKVDLVNAFSVNFGCSRIVTPKVTPLTETDFIGFVFKTFQ